MGRDCAELCVDYMAARMTVSVYVCMYCCAEPSGVQVARTLDCAHDQQRFVEVSWFPT